MSVGIGMRVLVTFGRSKTYLGIVARLHNEKPKDYQVKPISQVMDATTDKLIDKLGDDLDHEVGKMGKIYKGIAAVLQ